METARYTASNLKEMEMMLSELMSYQNYSNPLSPVATIWCGLGGEVYGKLKFCNTIGHEVATLGDEVQGKEYRAVIFEGKCLRSGVYFIDMEVKAREELTASFCPIQKMLMMKIATLAFQISH